MHNAETDQGMPPGFLSLNKTRRPTVTWLAVMVYIVTLAIGIGGFYAVRVIGEKASETVATATISSAAGSDAAVSTHVPSSPAKKLDVIFHVLATLATVIAAGFVLGKLFHYIGQPPVIGEVVAGICLGPSLLGLISPDWMHLLIPGRDVDPNSQVIVALQTVAQLGVLLYMFVVGLELNAATLKERAPTAVAISHFSIVLPFLLGAILALWLHPRYSPSGVSFTSFSLFVGVAMSITAFPVLARILTDRGLNQTRLGGIALAAAAADDLTAWCLLALVIGIVQSSLDSAIYVALGSIAFVVVMLFAVRPLAHRWCMQYEKVTGPLPVSAFVIGLAAVLVAGLTTETIGIHAIFGGFLLGAIIPHDSRLATEFKLRLSYLVTTLMLPAFFALTGMRTEIGLVSGWENWLFCAIVVFVATLGKFGGTFLAARCTGSDWREASALGILMNTRGLMELIVLNIGLDLGVISPTLFSMMVIMALITTMVTSPVLGWLVGQSRRD